MALPPLQCGEMGAFYRILGPMELSAAIGFTRPVLQKCLPRLKVLSKYGIGVDKVDLQAAIELRIPVTFCPGVNHVTVAEHTFGLLLALARQIPSTTPLSSGASGTAGSGVNSPRKPSAFSGWAASAGKSPNGRWPLTCGCVPMTSPGMRPSPNTG